MFRFNRKKIQIFNIFAVPIMFVIWIFELFDLQKSESVYRAGMILPIAFVIGYVFFLIVRKYNILDIHLIILLLFFVKMYVFPLLVIYCGRFNIAKYNLSLLQNVFDAILVQLLEWCSVVVALCFIRVDTREKYQFSREIDDDVNRKVWRVIFLCVFIIIIASIIYPSLLYKFRPIFFSSETQEILWKQNSTIAVSSINGIIYYPINWLIIVTRLSFVYLMVIRIWKKREYKSESISILVSFLIIAIGLVLIVPDDVAASIIAAFCLLSLMTKLYPTKSKRILFIVMVVSALFFIYVFFGKAFVKDASIEDSLLLLSQRLNAYFSGYINMAAVPDMKCNDKLGYFMGDFFRSFPVIKGFFINMPTSTELFNATLGYDAIYNSQIIPLEGQAYFYFGYVGVLIVPFLVVKLCMKFYNKMLVATGTYGFFIYCFYSLILAFGVVMYDGFLIFYICLSYVPLLIINSFINRREVAI